MTKMRFLAALVFLVLAAATARAGERTVELSIANMYCALCPLTVATAIGKVEGVEDVAVDYKNKTATVVYDDEKATVAEVAAASTRAGYPANEVK